MSDIEKIKEAIKKDKSRGDRPVFIPQYVNRLWVGDRQICTVSDLKDLCDSHDDQAAEIERLTAALDEVILKERI